MNIIRIQSIKLYKFSYKTGRNPFRIPGCQLHPYYKPIDGTATSRSNSFAKLYYKRPFYRTELQWNAFSVQLKRDRAIWMYSCISFCCCPVKRMDLRFFRCENDTVFKSFGIECTMRLSKISIFSFSVKQLAYWNFSVYFDELITV